MDAKVIKQNLRNSHRRHSNNKLGPTLSWPVRHFKAIASLVNFNQFFSNFVILMAFLQDPTRENEAAILFIVPARNSVGDSV
mmetsp:Transcript_5652/g.10916  ORF Transcript_5652/g.10916 Transcript_5652/m.10916 type:complete len:82 (-) Transcript_5652:472-717(-)